MPNSSQTRSFPRICTGRGYLVRFFRILSFVGQKCELNAATAVKNAYLRRNAWLPEPSKFCPRPKAHKFSLHCKAIKGINQFDSAQIRNLTKNFQLEVPNPDITLWDNQQVDVFKRAERLSLYLVTPTRLKNEGQKNAECAGMPPFYNVRQAKERSACILSPPLLISADWDIHTRGDLQRPEKKGGGRENGERGIITDVYVGRHNLPVFVRMVEFAY